MINCPSLSLFRNCIEVLVNIYFFFHFQPHFGRPVEPVMGLVISRPITVGAECKRQAKTGRRGAIVKSISCCNTKYYKRFTTFFVLPAKAWFWEISCKTSSSAGMIFPCEEIFSPCKEAALSHGAGSSPCGETSLSHEAISSPSAEIILSCQAASSPCKEAALSHGAVSSPCRETSLSYGEDLSPSEEMVLSHEETSSPYKEMSLSHGKMPPPDGG